MSRMTFLRSARIAFAVSARNWLSESCACFAVVLTVFVIGSPFCPAVHAGSHGIGWRARKDAPFLRQGCWSGRLVAEVDDQRSGRAAARAAIHSFTSRSIQPTLCGPSLTGAGNSVL